MATILRTSESSGGGNFEPHPPGSFLAVLADVFVKSYPNKYKGQILTMGKNKGKPDDRETVDKVCFAFLTEEPIEIDGTLKPRYAAYWASAGLGTADYPSNARKFLKAWWPTLTDAIIDAGLDLDKFIGKGAYITVQNDPDKNDPTKVYSKVAGAMQPPKGSTTPLIPSDFVRHQDKAAAPAPEKAPLAARAPDLKLADNSLPAMDKYEATASNPAESDVNPW